MMLLVKTRMMWAFVVMAFLCATQPANAAYNLLTNGDFESPVVPNLNGNNLSGTNWGSWTGGNQLNPIRVNGTTYTVGADNAYSGNQYLDVAGAANVEQSFVLPGTRLITFGAAFSNRDSANAAYIPPTSLIQIVNASNSVVASSTAVTLTKLMGDEVWLTSTGTATLAAGTYTFRIALGDYAHVDAAYVKTTTITFQKITDFGVGGPFTFTQTNMTAAPGSITTTAASTATPVSPTAISVVSLNTAVAITESTHIAFQLMAFSCTDANSAYTGNPASFGTSSGASFQIQAFTIVPGADIRCTSRSSKYASLTVTTISNGGVAGFPFLAGNGWGTQTLTTTSTGVGVTGAESFFNVANVGTTLSESIPTDYVVTAITCTGLNAGGTATYNVAGGNVVLSAANFGYGATVFCTFTNAKKPTLTLIKISNNGVRSFFIFATNGFGGQTLTTVTSGVGVTSTTKTLTSASTATTVSEAVYSDFKLVAISCTGMGTGGTATVDVASSSVVLNAAATAPLANITCTFTSDKLIPSMTVVKSASTAGPVPVGTVITYTFVVRNTGNTTITGVAVGETFNGNGTAPLPRNEVLSLDVAPLNDSTDATANNGSWSVLSPGDQVTFTANYTVTQSDIDLLQ